MRTYFEKGHIVGSSGGQIADYKAFICLILFAEQQDFLLLLLLLGRDIDT